MILNETYFDGMAVSLRNAIALGEEYVVRYVRGEIEMAFFRGQLELVNEEFNRLSVSSLAICNRDIWPLVSNADDTGDMRELRVEVAQCGNGALEGDGEERLLDYAS